MSLPIQPHHASQASPQTKFPLQLPFHPPHAWFKFVQQALIIPNLPAPLHYLNFRVLIGQPNIPIFKNHLANQTSALDTITLMSSVSPHMHGQFSHYSIEQACILKNDHYQFGPNNHITGTLPKLQLQREDAELSIDLNINTHPIVSYFSKMRFGLYEHWSLMCDCQGLVVYKGKRFEIDHLGSFEYARAIYLPYLPLCFYTYQVIQLKDQRQLLLLHIRNHFNQVLQSKIYLRDLNQASSVCFEHQVHFKVHRVYPKVMTPNQQTMYLPREFEWRCKQGKQSIRIYAQSRGDFKFGLGAGYAGSFNYQIEIDQLQEEGTAGYCEYIDCRPLMWQEKNHPEMLREQLEHPIAVTIKNNK
ncbi:hypothetical protein EC844_1011 [Acinetobacter calcoaceticus]|uniref:Uncharacterized protein n=1 Tax=Acinetobacter calcoaceticus TaxID=471 RepID=A0A4R1Y4U3_ACICA|nr:hypothetical protein EC844_1011 [Acinetobacter calcoaceticus]